MQRTSRHESVQNKVNMWAFGCFSSLLYSVFWMSFFSFLQMYLDHQCIEAMVCSKYSKRTLVVFWILWRLICSLFCWLIDKISAFVSILQFQISQVVLFEIRPSILYMSWTSLVGCQFFHNTLTSMPNVGPLTRISRERSGHTCTKTIFVT